VVKTIEKEKRKTGKLIISVEEWEKEV